VARVSAPQSIFPTQRAILFYAGGASVPSSCRNATSLIIPGRSEYGNPGLNEAVAAGALPLQYHNMSVYVNVALYHNWMYSTSSGSPALTTYGSGGTSYGPPINWLALSDAQIRAKLDSTFRKMRAELPWMRGLFLDDCGPDWSGYATVGASAQESFYLKHVVIATKIGELANEFGWFILSNGMWNGNNNHGYPIRTTHGCSLYDGFCIEHHSIGEAPFWDAVGGGQWRLRDPGGQRFMFSICNSSSDTTAWRNRANQAWIAEQTTSGYTANPPPVNTSLTPHNLGLTTGGAPSVTVTVTPTSVSVQTGTTQQFTGVASPSSALTWTVNNVVGGNTTVGTITSAGLYTAPISVPTGAIVTVRAAVASGESGSSTVTVTQGAPDPPDDQLPAPPAPINQVFGNRFAGIIPNNMTPDYSRGVIITPDESGTITHMVVGIDGNGPGVASQPFKIRLYSVTGTVVGSLLVSSAEYTVTTGLDPVWVSLALDTPQAVVLDVPIFAAIHTGGTEATGRFFRNETGGVSRTLYDVYADGGVASFTGPSTGNADVSIYADYIPAGTAGAAIEGASQGGSTTAGNLTSAAVAVTSVAYRLEPRTVVRMTPVPYEVDSVTGEWGQQLAWNSATSQFEPAT
jgi:hypothetical protein